MIIERFIEFNCITTIKVITKIIKKVPDNLCSGLLD
jgi:hypothetical protein